MAFGRGYHLRVARLLESVDPAYVLGRRGVLYCVLETFIEPNWMCDTGICLCLCTANDADAVHDVNDGRRFSMLYSPLTRTDDVLGGDTWHRSRWRCWRPGLINRSWMCVMNDADAMHDAKVDRSCRYEVTERVRVGVDIKCHWSSKGRGTLLPITSGFGYTTPFPDLAFVIWAARWYTTQHHVRLPLGERPLCKKWTRGSARDSDGPCCVDPEVTPSS